jgi:hypothetical protein
MRKRREIIIAQTADRQIGQEEGVPDALLAKNGKLRQRR